MPGEYPSSSPPPLPPPPQRAWPSTPRPSPTRTAQEAHQHESETNAMAGWLAARFASLMQSVQSMQASLSPMQERPADPPVPTSQTNNHSAAQSEAIDTSNDSYAALPPAPPKPLPGTHMQERLFALRQSEGKGETALRDPRSSYRAPQSSSYTPRKAASLAVRDTFYNRSRLDRNRNLKLQESRKTRDSGVDDLLERANQARIKATETEDTYFRESLNRVRERRRQSEKGVAGRAQEREEEERQAREKQKALEEQQAQEELLAQQEEERKIREEQEALEKARAEEQARRDILIRPLEPKWEAIVNEAMSCTNAQKVFSKSPDGSEITRYALGKILPQDGEKAMAASVQSRNTMKGWLNDECVDNWVAMLVARRLEQDGYVKGPNNIPSLASYLSAFWKNYNDKGVNSIKTWSRRKGISGKKLLSVERVFFPINTGAHWILLVISPKDRLIEVFDSAQSGGSKYFRFAHEWLAMELGQDYCSDHWHHGTAQSSYQMNMDDCGVFTCMNALASAKNKPPSAVVSTDGMKDARKMMVAVLLSGGFKDDWDL